MGDCGSKWGALLPLASTKTIGEKGGNSGVEVKNMEKA